MTRVIDQETTAECKAENCQRIPQKNGEFCPRCWNRVPKMVRDLMLREFRLGQGENGIIPSLDYTVAVRLAISCISYHKANGKAPPGKAIIEVQHGIAAKMSQEISEAIVEKALREEKRIEQANAELASPSESPEIKTPKKEKAK